MSPSKLGHIFPIVDQTKCIDCGRCTKNCPELNPTDLHAPLHAFAAWSRDEADYKSSTSGGASSVLAQYVIHNGGVVYGCTVLSGATVEHIRIDKPEDLFKIKGSKYVQSSIVNVLPLIKKDLKENKLVLFIGTPCQVAAVKKNTKSTQRNLYLVDLVCHGTPSQASLRSYLKRHVPLDRIDNIQFRSEKGYAISVLNNNQSIYTSPELWSNRYKDPFYNAFMDGYSFRDSCYQCRYASPKRSSDITIGDFWGLGKELSCDDIPEHRFGISLVLPNTPEGQDLFDAVSKSLYVYERPVSEAINGNDQLRHPKEKSKAVRAYRFLQPVLGDNCAYIMVSRLWRAYNMVKKSVTR